MKALRAVLAALALSAVFTGAWAAFAPRSFYTDFPGAGRHWVDRAPPFNEHLITDVGAFYLAFAVLFAWAAVRPSRELVVPVALAWSLFSVIHFVWHVTHLDGFPVADAIAQTAALGIVLAGAAIAIALSRAPARSNGAR